MLQKGVMWVFGPWVERGVWGRPVLALALQLGARTPDGFPEVLSVGFLNLHD